jgi:hypothetical protein
MVLGKTTRMKDGRQMEIRTVKVRVFWDFRPVGRKRVLAPVIEMPKVRNEEIRVVSR